MTCTWRASTAERAGSPSRTTCRGLDLHAFAVDPADADHAWTFAVGFGLFETTDAGRHWELR